MIETFEKKLVPRALGNPAPRRRAFAVRGNLRQKTTLCLCKRIRLCGELVMSDGRHDSIPALIRRAECPCCNCCAGRLLFVLPRHKDNATIHPRVVVFLKQCTTKLKKQNVSLFFSYDFV